MTDDRPFVEMRGIVKRFPGVVALAGVDFEVRRGEVVALLGENGAGKTTLMNILYGLYIPDEGEIYVEGRRVVIRSPQDAIRLGINMVHQQFMLIEEFSVLENVVLGSRLVGSVLDFEAAAKRVREVASELGFKIPLESKVKSLSAGEKQRVEIVKALVRNARLLILDEPTSVLTPQEVRELFRVVLKLKERGVGVVFISHKLGEVMEIADRIVVLRRGKKVGEVSREQANPALLARMMVGKETLIALSRPAVKPLDKVLEVRGLVVLNDEGLPAVRGVTLSVRRGEVVGIAGVAGNGQKELVEAIYGLRRAAGGRVILMGRDVTNAPIIERLRMGVSYIPQGRLRYGVAGDMSVLENLFVDRWFERTSAVKFVGPLGLFDSARALEYATQLIGKYEIVAPSPMAKARTLSGGNLQRLILARELERGPSLIIAEEPTAGLDIKATEYVRQTILNMKERGVGVLLVSGDLSEIVQLSDKVAVMYNGEIVGVFKPEEVTDEIGLYMTGVSRMPREVVESSWA